MLSDFFHRLFHPHCEQCYVHDREKEERAALEKECRYCKILQLELAKEREEKRQLLNAILDAQKAGTEMVERSSVSLENLKPIPSGYVSWRSERQRLEEESRKLAESQSKQTIEELEKEVLGENHGVS